MRCASLAFCASLLALSLLRRSRPAEDAGSARRVRLVLSLFGAVTLLFCGVSAARAYAALQTPVWGVTVQPEWVLVRGTAPVAVVTLAIPDARHAGFRNESLAEKKAYAEARGYWLVACDVSLDARRAPVWSKLRLLAAVLEQVAPTVLWVDLDTLIWTRDVGVEALLAASPGADLHAQHDFHRYTVYFNAGVMLLRRTAWTYWLLAAAYDSHRVVLLRGWVYNMAEQDALNLAATASQRRPRGTLARAEGWKVRIHTYPRLWALAHEALEADGTTPAEDVLAVHFPNCRDGECHRRYLQLYQRAMDMPTERTPGAAAPALPKSRRQFPPDMPRRPAGVLGALLDT